MSWNPEQTHYTDKARSEKDAAITRMNIKDFEKPPLGIMPESIWREIRMWELIECLARERQYDRERGVGTASTKEAFQASITGQRLVELRDRINDWLKLP